jgi:hypothetical protein
MISYPYHPLELGNKTEARKKLKLPLNEKIIFSFGFRSKEIVAVLSTLNDLAQEYPLRYLVISNPESELDELHKAKKKYNFIDLRVRALPLDKLYDYLYTSDVLLTHRESSQKYPAVLSSSVCQLCGKGSGKIYKII